MKKILLIFLKLSLMLLLPVMAAKGQQMPCGTIAYQPGKRVLLKDYQTNANLLSQLLEWINTDYRPASSQGGYLCVTAHYRSETPEAINNAAVQAEMVVSYLRTRSGLGAIRYTFRLKQSETLDLIELKCMEGAIPEGANTQIHYSLRKEWLNIALSRYPASAYLKGEQSEADWGREVNPEKDYVSTNDQTSKKETIRPVDSDVRQIDVLFYYRFDKSKLDSAYLSNPSSIRLVDSLMNLQSALFIDSLHIIGHASPEGPTEYNRRLSMRRAEAVKEYLVKRYPDRVSSRTVVTHAGGENWVRFRRMAEKDSKLPMKEKVLQVLNDVSLDDEQRQRKIERLDNGNLYRQYLLPNYYRYLRTGASLLFLYNPNMPADVNRRTIPLLSLKSAVPILDTFAISRIHGLALPLALETTMRYIRPVAIETNLLGDLATLFNVEVEFPVGRHFSLLTEWNFPFWGGLGNAGGVAPLPIYSEDYTIQMLAGGLEARYWFPRSNALHAKARKWGDYNPLVGWFVGLYGGVGLYDFQWKQHGMQGELFLNAGLTSGFAHPISKHFHMEYSAGVGYLQTQYYNYMMKDGHKVVDVRDDGKYDRRQQSYFGPTKLKVSLVWIPQFRIQGKNTEAKATMTAE